MNSDEKRTEIKERLQTLRDWYVKIILPSDEEIEELATEMSSLENLTLSYIKDMLAHNTEMRAIQMEAIQNLNKIAKEKGYDKAND